MPDFPAFDTLWNYDHPAETERAFRDLLAQAGTYLSYELQLLTQIGRAQGLQRQFDAGHQTLDQVERRLTPETSTAKIRYLLERGRLFNSSGAVEQARPLFEQAWQLGQQAGEPGYAVDAAHMLGILESPQLTWNLRALDLAENSGDPRAERWRASLYNNIGWTYHDRGDYPHALDMFERALRLREEQGKPEPLRIARWSVARVLRSLQQWHAALAIQQALAAELEQINQQDAYVDEELGECLLALGRADDAKSCFAQAYALLSQDDWLMQNEAPRLERIRALAG
ncbi:MAG: tetratricopeptide repeat protein [Chloroflexota bacterium]